MGYDRVFLRPVVGLSIAIVFAFLATPFLGACNARAGTNGASVSSLDQPIPFSTGHDSASLAGSTGSLNWTTSSCSDNASAPTLQSSNQAIPVAEEPSVLAMNLTDYVNWIPASVETADAASADLIVEKIWVAYANGTAVERDENGLCRITAGQSFSVHALVENAGPSAAKAFSTCLWIDGKMQKTDWDVASLAPGDLIELSTSPDMWASGSRCHSIAVLSDANLQVPENNKSNNFLSQEILTLSAAWTFIGFMSGGTTGSPLDDQLAYNIGLMESVGSDSTLNIVILEDPTNGNTHAYNVLHNSLQDIPLNQINPSWGNEVVMDAAAFQTFGNYVIPRYTATHYAVVVFDHGSGIFGAVYDENTNGVMVIHDIGAALASMKQTNSNTNINLFGIDCCSMQLAEVAQEVRNSVNVLVGSEAEEYFYTSGDKSTWEYDEVLSYMKASPTPTESQVGTKIVDTYIGDRADDWLWSRSVTLSALQLSGMSGLDQKINSLSQSLLGIMSPSTRTSVNTAISNTQKYTNGVGGYENADLYDFAQKIYDSITNTNVRQAATDIKNYLAQGGSLVIDNKYLDKNNPCHVDRAHGIAIHVDDDGMYELEYIEPVYRLLLYDETYWDEFLLSQFDYPNLLQDSISSISGWTQELAGNAWIGLDSGTGGLAAPSLAIDKYDASGGARAREAFDAKSSNWASTHLLVEANIKVNTIGSIAYVMVKGGVSNWAVHFAFDGVQGKVYSSAYGGWKAVTGCTISAGVWYHVALDIAYNGFAIYVDGVKYLNSGNLWRYYDGLTGYHLLDNVAFQAGWWGVGYAINMNVDDVVVRYASVGFADTFVSNPHSTWTLQETGSNDVAWSSTEGALKAPDMALLKLHVSGGVTATHTFASTNSGLLMVEARMKVDNTTSVAYLMVKTAMTYGVHFAFFGNEMQYYDGGWKSLDTPTYVGANTWYTITLVINPNSGTYDIYVNYVLKKADAKFYDGVLGPHTVDRVTFQAGWFDVSSYKKQYVDDVSILPLTY